MAGHTDTQSPVRPTRTGGKRKVRFMTCEGRCECVAPIEGAEPEERLEEESEDAQQVKGIRVEERPSAE